MMLEDIIYAPIRKTKRTVDLVLGDRIRIKSVLMDHRDDENIYKDMDIVIEKIVKISTDGISHHLVDIFYDEDHFIRLSGNWSVEIIG